MRVAFLSWRDTAHRQAGGSEVVIDQLARGLVDRGHEIFLFHGGPSDTHPYGSRSVGGTYGQYVRMPWSFRRHAGDVDVVVDVENGIPFFSPIWQSAPVVLLVHHVHTAQWSMQFPVPIASLGRWLEGRAVPSVYRNSPVVAVSNSTASDLGALGVDADRITVIELGTDFVPAPRVPSSVPRFVVLGRLVPHKRVAIALSCWEQVRRVTGGELVIVGDGPELERLRAQAGEGVRFLGRVDEESKRVELSEAWALIHPAHHEGWGVVVMEAALAGIPTVGFDVPGLRDSVVDGETGLLARGEAEFVEHWIRLASDERLRNSLGEAASRRASTFTLTRSVEAFEELLERVAGTRGHQRHAPR